MEVGEVNVYISQCCKGGKEIFVVYVFKTLPICAAIGEPVHGKQLLIDALQLRSQICPAGWKAPVIVEKRHSARHSGGR